MKPNWYRDTAVRIAAVRGTRLDPGIESNATVV